MYSQTLYPKTKQVLERLSQLDLLNNFYLAGGTALALQIGHRKSIDLDFFSKNFPKRDLILQKLSDFNPTVTQEAPGTLDLIIDEVKVSFLEYKYPLLNDLVEFNGVKMASIIDILCMKLTAISSRSSKKDFYDLFFGLKQIGLSDLFIKFEEKYKGVDYQKMHILKSLTYFDLAEEDPEPDMIDEVSWEEVKEGVLKAVSDIK